MTVRQRIPSILVGFLAVTAIVSSAFAGVESAGSDSVRVEADTITYDGKTDMIEASGNVGIRHETYTLLSDKATLDVGANLLHVEGGVKMMRDEGVLSADRGSVDIGAQTGVLYNSRLHIKEGNFRISGSVVEKKGEGKYHADRAFFTTCDSDTPSWKFSATDVDVTVEEYAQGKNAFLYIADVPVFYLPYVAFPVMRERQSGFLTPRLGTSTKKGFYLATAWYEAISPSQDATVTLDLQTRRGVGVGAEYRYIRSLSSAGDMNGYLIFDRNIDQWRGSIVQKHEEILSPTLYVKSSINAVSDRKFYREYGEGSGDYNRKLLESTVFLTKHVDYYSITPQARYAQILDWDDAGYTYQKLPVLTVKGVRQPLGGMPLYLSFSSDFTNFVREKDGDGLRGRLRPQLTYNFHPVPHVDAAIWGAVEGRAYSSYNDGHGSDAASEAAAGLTLSSTLFRVFDSAKGAQLRHTIVPRIDYVFSRHSRRDEGRAFDYYDEPVNENRIVYSVANHLVALSAREDGSRFSREILQFRVSQSYQFSGGRRDLTTLVDRKGSWSDIRLEATAHPAEWFAIRLDTRFSPEKAQFSTANAAAEFHDRIGNTASLGYRFTEHVTLQREGWGGQDGDPGFGTDVSRIGVNYAEGKLKLINFQPFTFEYTGRFSVDRHAFLESLYSVEYRHQCWSVTLSYRDNVQAKEFLVSLSLAGLGSVGKMKAF